MNTLVIIGASNVTLSLPVIWAGLAGSASPRQRLLVAAGHGRSFALPNTVMGRMLPSILECGLWDALAEISSDEVADRRKPSGLGRLNGDGPDGLRRSATLSTSFDCQQPQALITDVGNDILYGASVEQIADWVRECVARLQSLGVQTRLTHLPLHSLRSLSRRRFLFFRKLLFPSSTLSYEDAMSAAAELDAALVELSDASGLERTEPQRHWYGLDPIHIRRRARPEAWQQFLAPLIEGFDPRHPGPLVQQRIWTRKAAFRWRGGREFVTPQPCLTAGSTELWLF